MKSDGGKADRGGGGEAPILRPDGGGDRVMARKACGQHGLITRRQAVSAGFSPERIEQRVTSGRWIRMGPGVYRLAGAPVTWLQRALASCLMAGPAAMVSHRSAAFLHSIAGFRAGRIEITVPVGRSGRHCLAVIHRTRLDPGPCQKIQGVPVTRLPRTMLDLATSVSLAALAEAVDDVLCRRRVTRSELSNQAALCSHRGSARLRASLTPWIEGPIPESVSEMQLIRQLVAAGLGQPQRQYEIRVDDQARLVVGQGPHDLGGGRGWGTGRVSGLEAAPGTLVARVDLAYPEALLAIEFDGFQWHAGRRQFAADRQRQNRIEAAGWRVLRATSEALSDGGELCAIVRRMMLEAA